MISVDELGEKFDHISPKVSKLLIIILVPLLASALMLLFRRSKRYFFDHFIFAAEYLSFLIFYVFFLLPMMFALMGLFFPVGDIGDSNVPFNVLQVAGCWLVATQGIRRFYGTSLGKAVPLALLFMLMLTLILMIIYRTVLFAVVMLFV